MVRPTQLNSIILNQASSQRTYYLILQFPSSSGSRGIVSFRQRIGCPQNHKRRGPFFHPAKPFRGCLRSPSKRHFLQTAAAGLAHAGLVTSIGEGPAQRRAIACATIHAHWVRSGKKGSPGLGKHMSLASSSPSPVRNSSRHAIVLLPLLLSLLASLLTSFKRKPPIAVCS